MLLADRPRMRPFRCLRGTKIPRPASVLEDRKQRSSHLLVAYDEYTSYATKVIELVPGELAHQYWANATVPIGRDVAVGPFLGSWEPNGGELAIEPQGGDRPC